MAFIYTPWSCLRLQTAVIHYEWKYSQLLFLWSNSYPITHAPITQRFYFYYFCPCIPFHSIITWSDCSLLLINFDRIIFVGKIYQNIFLHHIIRNNVKYKLLIFIKSVKIIVHTFYNFHIQEIFIKINLCAGRMVCESGGRCV